LPLVPRSPCSVIWGYSHRLRPVTPRRCDEPGSHPPTTAPPAGPATQAAPFSNSGRQRQGDRCGGGLPGQRRGVLHHRCRARDGRPMVLGQMAVAG